MSIRIDREALARSAVGKQSAMLDAAMSKLDRERTVSAMVSAGVALPAARQVWAELAGGPRLPKPETTGKHMARIEAEDPVTANELADGGYPVAHAETQAQRIKARRALARTTAGEVVTALAGADAPPIVLAAAADIAARYASDVPPLRSLAELTANEIACRVLCDQLDGTTCCLLRRECGGCAFTAPWAIRNTRTDCPRNLWPEHDELRPLQECEANRLACERCDRCKASGDRAERVLTCPEAKDALADDRWRVRHKSITCPLSKWAQESRRA